MLKSIKGNSFTFLSLFLMAMGFSFVLGCKSEPSSKKQQKAFYVDKNGDLRDKRDKVVKKSGEYKLEDGFYVDNNGEKINRRIDDTKEKINDMVDNTKEGVKNTIDKSKEGIKNSFNNMFNTRVKGEAYTLSDVAFKDDSHRLTGYSKPEIMALIESLKEHPEGRIQVQVYTADGKNKMECKELARLRAEVVKDMIVTLGGNKDQISSKGIGLTAKDAEKSVADKVEIVVEQ